MATPFKPHLPDELNLFTVGRNILKFDLRICRILCPVTAGKRE